MFRVGGITLLGIVCSFCVISTSGRNLNIKQPHGLGNEFSLQRFSDGKPSGDLLALLSSMNAGKPLVQKQNGSVNVIGEIKIILPTHIERSVHLARCVDLFKRKHSYYLFKKYWNFIQKLIKPHWLEVCSKYLADFSEQKNQRRIKSVHKREADPNQKGNSPYGVDSKGSNQLVKLTTISPAMKTAHIIPSNMQNTTVTTSADSASTAKWVFITIGVALGFLIILITVLAVMYRRRRPRSTTKSAMMQNFLHTVSKDRSLKSYSRSADDVSEESYEGVLSPGSTRDSLHINIDPQEQSSYPNNLVEYHEVMPQHKIQTPLLPSCLSYCHETDTVERAMSSSSFLNSQRDDGNRLRGGSGDFHRRYVDVDYVHNDIDLKRPKLQSQISCAWDQDLSFKDTGQTRTDAHRHSQEERWNTSMYRSSREGRRNRSNTSSSARSYICIPPTSPSENYIEAGSDDNSVRSTPPTKMAWLTKSLKVDAKNEIRNYQASLGTQTESDQDITAPMCKTVFGTPWQFGGTFTSRGGLLQAKDSDVCLVMTANAVSKGEYIDIYGAVFTDTTEIRKKLHFPARESLTTPVVEYHAVPVNHFNTNVCVRLPHALPDGFDSSLIRVYTFSVDERGKVSMSTVPLCSKAKNDGAYWEKGSDGCTIHIYTTHFSGYFCTLCETSSLPSICTMVFGSHVQITLTRREIRVILYIWDRRLTIKDYLERFRKQESDVDRQLLTDMQVPLLNDASSDSRLVMKMEVMGKDEDRSTWKHVSRPDGSRPLFKSLQVRKLSEIVHCCRQTDPIRVEWALENAPHQIPSAVFQCCIDIMHVHESTSDYETAMREGSDDLMRTFYVRDLKVVSHQPQELKPSTAVQLVDLKRALLEASDMMQTEKMCQEFGITVKDIGNFKKKYSTEEAIQAGLVEECLRRHGLDKFMNQLPHILERLQLTHIATALESRKILVRECENLPVHSDAVDHIKAVTHVKKPVESRCSDRDSTRRKSPYRRSSSPGRRNRSSSPMHRGRSKEDARLNQRPDLHQQVSEKSDDVFFANDPSSPPQGTHGHSRRSLSSDRESKPERPEFVRGRERQSERPQFDRGRERQSERPEFVRDRDRQSERPEFVRGRGRQSERPEFVRDRENRQSERPAFDRDRESRQSERPVFDRDRESKQSERPVFDRDRERRQSERPVFDREGRQSERPVFDRERRQSERPVFSSDRENRQPERQVFDKENRQSEGSLSEKDRDSGQSERQTFDRKRESRQSQRHDRHRINSPPSVDDEVNISSQNVGYTKARNTDQNTEQRQHVKNQHTSSSKGDSALNSSSISPTNTFEASSQFPSQSTAELSMVTHADPKDFAEPYPDEFLDDHLQQTYKKEFAAQRNFLNEDSIDIGSIRDRLQFSESGPQALSPESGQMGQSSFSDPVPPHQKLSSDHKPARKSQSTDTDETMKKEFYTTHTVV